MSLILSMIIFSFTMSITPGPVNIIIITSSLQKGFKYSFSFISGATIGFTLLLVCIALGLHQLVSQTILNYLSFFGILFLIYIGYQIIISSSELNINENKKLKVRFFDGFLLQWLNPKAWLASISGISMFSSSLSILFSFICIYFVVCYLSLSFWGIFGEKLDKWVLIKNYIKYLNLFMGISLIFISIYIGYKNFLEI